MDSPASKKHKHAVRYGLNWPNAESSAQIELFCIKRMGRWEGKDGKWYGEGLAHHIMEFVKIAWPKTEFHRWSKMLFEEMSKPGRTAVFGPSSSGKSFIFSQFALAMFYARPKGTTILISSTEQDSLRRRIWGYIVDLHREAKEVMPWLPGSMIESKLMLLADPRTAENRSFKDGIIGVAARRGGQWQGLTPFIGTKNDVLILGADELSMCPIGILDALANLESNIPCFATLMGNLPDIHNPLAKAAEPEMGWDSLPDTEVSRVYKTKWINGRAVQLIGTDSPNLDYPEGSEPYPKLIGRRYIEQCRHNYGEGTTKFEMFASGKLPRSGMECTVFTKAACLKYNTMTGVTWGHLAVVKGYGMDAAYSGIGGDRTAGAPFIFGKDAQGKWKLWIGEIKIYQGSRSAIISHSESIALDCKKECEAHGIQPEHVFFDGTGRSELTSAFARLWSSRVVPIEFGGPATERPSFNGEKHMDGELAGQIKTCREVFDRFVTELWFAIRHAITSDQLRGLSEELIEEGSQRKWEIVRGAKYSIETKGEMKDRGLPSPDLADFLCVAIEGARRLGFPLGVDAAPSKKAGFVWLRHKAEEDWKKTQEESLVIA